ncbi:MAG: hypothetical protein NUW07_09230, partial [Candidatus Saccharicenans sp.]|nr:hypothetical protein [Candidatus Saccharicenans sp.]
MIKMTQGQSNSQRNSLYPDGSMGLLLLAAFVISIFIFAFSSLNRPAFAYGVSLISDSLNRPSVPGPETAVSEYTSNSSDSNPQQPPKEKKEEKGQKEKANREPQTQAAEEEK